MVRCWGSWGTKGEAPSPNLRARPQGGGDTEGEASGPVVIGSHSPGYSETVGGGHASEVGGRSECHDQATV
jgi:hypothetical protein